MEGFPEWMVVLLRDTGWLRRGRPLLLSYMDREEVEAIPLEAGILLGDDEYAGAATALMAMPRTDGRACPPDIRAPGRVSELLTCAS